MMDKMAQYRPHKEKEESKHEKNYHKLFIILGSLEDGKKTESLRSSDRKIYQQYQRLENAF